MNKYEQLGVAGEGAYGIVLKCQHKETGELVAIKKFREPDEEDEEAKKTTMREVKILKALKHENIIQLREAFRRKGTLYLVFDYVEKCLMEVLESSPNGVGAEATRNLTCQLLRALEHCHRQSVIHRDIKPENVLIDPADNSLHLCDFGSACKLNGDAILTDYVATRWYRAPELLVSFNNYGKGVDMWGVGCVMAELTVGQPLFTGTSDLDQLCLINKALGPLTSEQAQRCMELTGFRDLHFPQNVERETLKMRLGHAMSEPEMQFLEAVLVMDPTQRLMAKEALATTWLKGAQGPRRPRSSSHSKQNAESGSLSAKPGSRQSSARNVSSRKSSRSQPRPLCAADGDQAESPSTSPNTGAVSTSSSAAAAPFSGRRPPLAGRSNMEQFGGTSAAARAGMKPSQPKPRARRSLSPCPGAHPAQRAAPPATARLASPPRALTPVAREWRAEEQQADDGYEDSIPEEINDAQTVDDEVDDAQEELACGASYDPESPGRSAAEVDISARPLSSAKPGSVHLKRRVRPASGSLMMRVDRD
mmetsp:Transcript_88088/g.247662  ORF Transcript_88088/g.247662 Transcript_88088/m.247662 type:complete len:535 (-) Transcript_88088:182-1786(-)